MTSPCTVIFRGPVASAETFRKLLEREGVEIAYDPPFETRSDVSDPGALTIYYLCTCTDAAIRNATTSLARFGSTASVEVLPKRADGSSAGG